jgi:hypothetical protein
MKCLLNHLSGLDVRQCVISDLSQLITLLSEYCNINTLYILLFDCLILSVTSLNMFYCPKTWKYDQILVLQFLQRYARNPTCALN